MSKLFPIALVAAAWLSACGSPSPQLRVASRGAIYGTVSRIGTEMEKQTSGASTTTYQYAVQLDSGELLNFTYARDQGLRAGQRVLIVDGNLQRP
jgi:hypothetical protein